MTSYPTAIWSPSAITTGTVLAEALLGDAIDEVLAIETELGLVPHGSAGSIAERLLNAMDEDGGILGHLLQADGTNGLRLRIRAGRTVVRTEDLDSSDAKFSRGVITFSPPLAALPTSCHAIVNLEYTEDDRAAADTPILVSYEHNSGDTTSFAYRVASSLNAPPVDGTQFILHWIAWERSSNNGTGY